jgi:hypothetical protein
MTDFSIGAQASGAQAILASTPQVERYVRERRETNQKFVSWGLYYFVLSWVTIGIYPVIIFYRRLNRADLFRDRKAGYYKSLAALTGQYAQNKGDNAVLSLVEDLERQTSHRFTLEHKRINAGLSLLLSFLTLGIYGLYAIYRDMRFWWEIQLTEQEFYDRLGVIWVRLGIVRHAVSFQPISALKRSFGLTLLLSVVTFGIYGVVWDYHLHTDPEKLFPESDSAEDGILAVLRQLS